MDLLITGASGNVGGEVLRALSGSGHRLFSGGRTLRSVEGFQANPTPVVVDFETQVWPDRHFDAVFLLRPPQIGDPAPFRAFLATLEPTTRVVFLSVQGAERMSFLPHAKIESVITELGLPHVFVRPSYFMENLTSTLAGELERNKRIYLPAADLRLDWVSVADVAAMCAAALLGKVRAPAVTASSGQSIGFGEVVQIINRQAGTSFEYEPASLLGFVRDSRAQQKEWSFIGVMLLLHFLPRFTRQKLDAGDIEGTLGRPPESLERWAERNKETLRALQQPDAAH